MTNNWDLVERIPEPPAVYVEARRVRFGEKAALVVCEAADRNCYIRVEQDGTAPRWYVYRDEPDSLSVS